MIKLRAVLEQTTRASTHAAGTTNCVFGQRVARVEGSRSVQMGKRFDSTIKKGPGRKARKQPDAQLPRGLGKASHCVASFA